jgi:hypothetical protein
MGLEVLVIDSGWRDHSVDIARAAGVSILEIEPASFGHGRTRNMGAPRTSGELVGFLTQDATPVPGCLAAHRELTEFLRRLPRRPRRLGLPLQSQRQLQARLPRGGQFDDVAYSEDQAFARAMRVAGHRLGEGLQPARRPAARPRLPADHLHAPATSTSTAACASQRRSSARDQYRPRVGPLMMQNSGPTGRPRRNSSQGWSSPQPHASMPTSRPSALAAPDQERAAALIEIGVGQCQRFLEAQSGPP